MYNILVRLISLNIWGGKQHDSLISFINKNNAKTDIFTFQEVLKYKENILTHKYKANILGELTKLLTNFNCYFSPRSFNHDPDGKIDIPVEFGQATFVNKKIYINSQNEIFVYKSFNLMNKYFKDGNVDFPSSFIYSILEKGGKKFMVINFHGLWEPAPKHDTEHRLRQSQIIIDHIEHLGIPTILAGDFNLRIETKAISMFEDFGMRNLIKESGALTTRSTLYDEEWRKIDKYADYIFTSPGIYVNEFKVLRAKVSDHLPLYLKFDI